MKIENPKSFIPFAIGYICVIVGTFLFVFEAQPRYSLQLAWEYSVGFWIFAVGAVAVAVVRIATLPKTDDKRTRRLLAQQMIGTACLLTTIYLMCVNNNAWAITLIISAFIDFWVSLRIR